jgi:fatty acid desaturase
VGRRARPSSHRECRASGDVQYVRRGRDDAPPSIDESQAVLAFSTRADVGGGLEPQVTHNPKAAPLHVVSRWLGLPVRRLLRGAHDVRRYAWQSGLCLTAMYAVLAAAMAHVIPGWVLLVLIPPLYVRSALTIHELMHVRSERQVPWLHRLMMALESPLSLGYREHRDIHLRHHRFCATDGDPEFFQIRGGHVRAFAAAVLSPEWMLYDCVRQRRVGRTWLAEASIRFFGFLAVVAINPAAFLYYWIAVRASIGVSQYAFHHMLHQRGGTYGTYAVRLPRRVERAIRLVLGSECVHILTEHPAHHAWQGVKPDRLRVVAVALLENEDDLVARDAGHRRLPAACS